MYIYLISRKNRINTYLLGGFLFLDFFSSSTKFPATNLPKAIISAAHLSNTMDIDFEQISYEMAQKTIELFNSQEDFDDDR